MCSYIPSCTSFSRNIEQIRHKITDWLLRQHRQEISFYVTKKKLYKM